MHRRGPSRPFRGHSNGQQSGRRGGGYHQTARPGYGGGGDYGSRMSGASQVDIGTAGHLVCNHPTERGACTWRSHSDISMTLHRADRHLVLPPGGAEELARIDPLLEEERKEKARRARKGGGAGGPDEEERQSMLITGLNISLSTPELIDQWIAERKKRWPSQAVIAKRERESWDTKDTRYKGKQRSVMAATTSSEVSQPVIKKEQVKRVEKPEETAPLSASSSSSSSSSSYDDSDEDNSSGSNVDEVKNAVSSKIQPQALSALEEEPPQKVCRFFQQGRCSFGEKCRDRHEPLAANQQQQQTQQKKATNERRRKRPRPASPNPFEAPHLLRALLKNEIAQHVNYVAQVVRFLVRNDYLQGFEEKEGQAEARAKERERIIVQVEDDTSNVEVEEVAPLGQPVIEGGLPTFGNSLIEPPPAQLKPLHSLALPPEPDPLTFMDPLRSNDPKPLQHAQYRQLAIDGGIRSLLVDEEQKKVPASLIRALSTLDALPSSAHVTSAIELILGVSEQSQQHPHQLGASYVRSDRNPSGSRVIGESELFRCGLRVGPLEIVKIRQIAARISAVVGGPSFVVDEGGIEGSGDDMRPWWDKETREEMRRKKWAKEADWRDNMKKLGLQVD